MDALIGQWTAKKQHIALMAELQKAGVPAAAVLNVAELADDPHLHARRYFHSALSSGDGEPATQAQFMGVPFKLDGLRTSVLRGPHLGEHNLVVGASLTGLASDNIPVLDEASIGTAYDY